MTIQEFIKNRSHLFWYVQDLENLSLDVIVEAVLNDGTWDDVQKLINILGIKKVSEIFREKSAMKRSNYRPEIKNYFTLYFNRYA